MPPQRPAKKGGLTLEKLASYDDVITDALVDKVYYWTTIRKNRGGRFTASRGLHEEHVADIVRQHVILDKDPAEAVQHLLRLPGLRKYLATLKDEKDQEQFKRHLRRYVGIYMPECPFEVTTTNRYTITDHEASITARRDIAPREEIKYLTGVQVAMTEEQEKTLELARKDFSLVVSSRKKTRSLFLGPARFANHDCDANATLSTKGYEGMQIVAVKPIEMGDEITVSYGEDYFGEDNEECLCHTCEVRQVNGWAPMKPKSVEDDEDETAADAAPKTQPKAEQVTVKSSCPEASPYSLRKRKLSSECEEASRDSTPAAKKTKTESRSPLSPPKPSTQNALREAALKKSLSHSSLRQELPVSSIEDPTTNLAPSFQLPPEAQAGMSVLDVDESTASRDTTPQSAADSPKSTHSTDVTSVDEDHPVHDMVKTKVDPEVIHQKPTLGVATFKDETSRVDTQKPLTDHDTSSELSELSGGYDNYEFDDDNQEYTKRGPTVRRTTRSLSRLNAQNRVGTPVQDDTIEEGYVKNERQPGDYMTSNALLSAKYSKWVECQTCDVEFVQQDGYNTRKECPRCERHSKLYGFPWPKTDREGKHDKEQRVLDHRTVHRFVDPEEEKMLKKSRAQKRMRESIKSRYSTPRSQTRERTSSSFSVEAEGGRKTRRLRKTL